MRYRSPPVGFYSALNDEHRRQYPQQKHYLHGYLPAAPAPAYDRPSHFHAQPQYHHHHRGHGFPSPPIHYPPGLSPAAAAYQHNLVELAPAPVGVRSPHTVSVISRGVGGSGSGNFSHNLPRGSVEIDRVDVRRSVPGTQLPQTVGGSGSGNFSHNLPRGSVEIDRDRVDVRRSVPGTQLPQTAPSADLNPSSPASDLSQKEHGHRPAQAPPPAVGNAAKAQLIPLSPPVRCDICRVGFTSSEGLDRHKNGRQHKKSLVLQKFGKIPIQKEVEEKPQQTLASTTEQKMGCETESQTDPTEAVKERRLLKRKAARRFRKDVKNMRYFRPPVAPPKEQPRCCILCSVTYQTADNFETHLSGKTHISRLSLCADEDTVYGMINAHIAPDQLSIFREQVPMFYGLKTREMLQQEARGEAIVLQYDWRPKEEVLTVNGGDLENVKLDSTDQKGKDQIGFGLEVAMLNEVHVAVPEYNVDLLGLGADSEEIGSSGLTN